MNLQEEKFQKMTTQPVGKLVCQMAVPSMVSMLVSAIYNIADTFFIGKISTQATGAIGIVFSYMALIQAISFFFGHGSGNYISRALGRKDVEEAEKMASTGFFSAVIIGFLLIFFCFIFMTPFLKLLGATQTILPEAEPYFSYILLATPFIMASFVLNNQMRLQGNASKSMLGIAAGAVLNVILDPILIFGCKMGIRGAAIATAVSQIMSFILLLILSRQGDGIKIKWKNFSPSKSTYREIIAGGLPSLGRQGLASVAGMCLNQAAGLYGDSAIAAFSVVNRVGFIALAALLGFGQGFQPVCGFNYGAKKYERVKEAFWFSVKAVIIPLMIFSAAGFIFAGQIVAAFRADDMELIYIGTKVLRYQSVVFPLMGWIIIVNMFLQNTRKTIRATIMAMARQGIIFLPVLVIASHTMGLLGVELAQPISDLLTFCLAIPLGGSGLKELQKKN